jgi:hypothetical protein
MVFCTPLDIFKPPQLKLWARAYFTPEMRVWLVSGLELRVTFPKMSSSVFPKPIVVGYRVINTNPSKASSP